jgi:hypothetical protein
MSVIKGIARQGRFDNQRDAYIASFSLLAHEVVRAGKISPDMYQKVADSVV